MVWVVLRHMGTFIGTLIGAVVLVQALLILAPGDAIDSLPNAEEVRAVLEAEWQLDQSPPVQVLSYLYDVATGNLRTSLVYRPGKPVVEIIAMPVLRSLSILMAALTLSVGCGTAMAWFTAGRMSPVRWVTQAVSIVPVFLIAHMGIYLFNVVAWQLMQANAIARPDWFALPIEDHPLRTALAIVVLAVGSGALADVQTEVENELVRIRASGYVDAARARGAALWPHVLLNLLPSLSTLIAAKAAFFVGGLVILEKILLINGVGAILWRATLERDYPLALGITLVTAAVVVAMRLFGDTVRVAVDPRRRGGQ
ncbi:MAG: peptide/nickel transport system permease protein [Kiritimatiellia bacterium]